MSQYFLIPQLQQSDLNNLLWFQLAGGTLHTADMMDVLRILFRVISFPDTAMSRGLHGHRIYLQSLSSI